MILDAVGYFNYSWFDKTTLWNYSYMILNEILGRDDNIGMFCFYYPSRRVCSSLENGRRRTLS